MNTFFKFFSEPVRPRVIVNVTCSVSEYRILRNRQSRTVNCCLVPNRPRDSKRYNNRTLVYLYRLRKNKPVGEAGRSSHINILCWQQALMNSNIYCSWSRTRRLRDNGTRSVGWNKRGAGAWNEELAPPPPLSCSLAALCAAL